MVPRLRRTGAHTQRKQTKKAKSNVDKKDRGRAKEDKKPSKEEKSAKDSRVSEQTKPKRNEEEKTDETRPRISQLTSRNP